MLIVFDVSEGGETHFRRQMSIALNALVALNVLYLTHHPHTPWLYESGVQYIKDPIGPPQKWKDIGQVLANNGGDCKDLAPWRIAELLVRCRRLAWPRWLWGHNAEGRYTLHVQAETADGIDNPARTLGMKGNM